MHRREDKMKMDRREVALKGVDWIHQVQDRDQRLVLLKL
jgi:hypothetical protein